MANCLVESVSIRKTAGPGGAAKSQCRNGVAHLSVVPLLWLAQFTQSASIADIHHLQLEGPSSEQRNSSFTSTMSSQAISSIPSTPATAGNLGSDLKPAGSASAQVKPCCVCKDEKAARDECMLFSTSDNAQEECQSMVDKYRTCMAGFGFKI